MIETFLLWVLIGAIVGTFLPFNIFDWLARRKRRRQRYLSFLVMFLALPTAAAADTWTVTYATRGACCAGPFYSPGAYEFLLAPGYVPVYLLASNGWNFVGMYQTPALGYGVAPLPSGIPPIAFPAGSDVAVAVGTGGSSGGSGRTIGAASPLEVIQAPDVYFVRAFQKAAAITATGVLRIMGAPVTRTDTTLRLPWVTVEVYRQCAGLTLVWFWMIAAGLVGLVLAWGWRLTAAFVVVSGSLAVVVNAVRIAEIAWRGFE